MQTLFYMAARQSRVKHEDAAEWQTKSFDHPAAVILVSYLSDIITAVRNSKAGDECLEDPDERLKIIISYVYSRFSGK